MASRRQLTLCTAWLSPLPCGTWCHGARYGLPPHPFPVSIFACCFWWLFVKLDWWSHTFELSEGQRQACLLQSLPLLTCLDGTILGCYNWKGASEVFSPNPVTLVVRRLRTREVKEITQGHTAIGGQVDLGLLTHNPGIFSSFNIKMSPVPIH